MMPPYKSIAMVKVNAISVLSDHGDNKTSGPLHLQFWS